MNRGGSAILTTALFMSMLASSGVRQKTPKRSGEKSVLPPVQSSTSTSTPANKPNPRDPTYKDPTTLGEQEYQNEITELFRQYCQDGGGITNCPLQPDDFVLALLPDPVHTHLALGFDRTIDTIQETLQDDGYMFDRAIVPWDSKAYPVPDNYELRVKAKRYQEGRERLPGVMLFRPSGNADAPKDPLVVMLVGETPTGGINARQFVNTIREIRQLTTAEQTKKKARLALRILGPSFSGSLASLTKLLTCEQSPCFQSATIFSGTISGREAVDGFLKQEARVNATFDTFQETDTVMLERFVEFIAGRSYGDRNSDVRRIAELSEDETEYGTARGKPTKYLAKSSYCKGLPVGFNQCSVLELLFPREISQLRAAYQDNTGLTNGTERLPFQTLPHNFGVTGADDDTVVSFSQKQTPLSQEAILLSIVAELRKHAIQFVILRATDPLDTLFLSHYLRGAYPQGRIVTIGADMLFPREVEDTSLHGILALSTYSVSPSANHQFYQLMLSGSERMFPSSSEIGIYNALHSLMTASVSRFDCKIPSPEMENACADQLRSRSQTKGLFLIQYGWRERGNFDKYNAPPVRLSALGHDGFWPIANLGPFKGENSGTLLPQVAGYPQFSFEPAPVEVPNSWLLIEVVGLAMGCGFCLSLWFASVTSPSQQLAQFAPTMAGARVWMVAATGFFLILVLLILLWPFVNGSQDWNIINSRRSELILMAGMLVVFGLTLLDILERSGLFDATTLRMRAWWSNFENAVAISVFAAAGISLEYFVFARPEYSQEKLAGIRHFETLRAIQLTSGLSPILPAFFLLAAGLWWANHVASGWILLDSRRPRLPSGIKHPRLAAIGEDREIASDLLSELLPGASSVTHYLALLGIGFGMWLLAGSLHPLRTLEPSRVDLVAVPLFLVTAWAGLVGTTLRLWSIWFRAHQFLSVLDSVPLRRGFQRLEGFSWKPIWKFGGGGALEEYRRILAREREALESAVNLLPELENSREKINRRFRQTLSWYRIARLYKHPFSLRDWATRRKAEQRLIEHFGTFQAGIALAARDALDYLAERWSKQKEEPIRRPGEETEDELKTRACERFVSLVYVSFLLVVLARMRTLIIAIGGMYILILLAMTLYPFEPKAAVQAFLAASLAFIVAVVGLVFAQIHRDATLSHITDTKPGELGVDFWLRMASFVALPLFSFFASQFPEVIRFFYSWLQPALQALNR